MFGIMGLISVIIPFFLAYYLLYVHAKRISSTKYRESKCVVLTMEEATDQSILDSLIENMNKSDYILTSINGLDSKNPYSKVILVFEIRV